MRPIGHHPLRAAVVADHPLAGRDEVDLSALADQTVVVWGQPGKSRYTDLLVDTCRRAGFEPRIAVNPVQGTPPITAVTDTDQVAFVTAAAGRVSDRDVIVLGLRPEIVVPVVALWVEANPAPLVAAFIDSRPRLCWRGGRSFCTGGVCPGAREPATIAELRRKPREGVVRSSIRRALHSAACCIVIVSLMVAAEAARAQSPSGAIAYKTIFQDPGIDPTQDPSLEAHAISLIDATPEGEQITFAFRDFNRRPVANALIAAHRRGVMVDGVIDGGERNRTIVRELQRELGSTRFVICGSPTFEFHSCIANSERPSLQHNKFLTFSKLDDGREHVVLQTSMNFFEPTQLNYYNDMVEIAGDAALYDAYVAYLLDMKQQVRSDDHYFVRSGDDGRNTMFPSPRRQPDPDTDDIIVDRLNEVDCSVGGSPSGKGLIRIANMAFRTERAVIMRKLIALKHEGCDIEVVVSNADGDIMAGLVSAGIPVYPFFLRAVGTRPQVIVHDKFWLVDAKSTLTGSRSRITFAGSSNWRADQQRSDDLLLRIVDDGVHAAYSGYWELLRTRAASDLPRPATDTVKPSSALRATPTANAAGWNNSDVTLRVAGSDGHLTTASGLARLHVEMSGAQTGSWDFLGETSGHNVQELVIFAEGETIVTFFSQDNEGNVEEPKSYAVRIDKSAPALAGLPRACELWPPNNKLVHVADVSATDAGSGLVDFSVTAWSDADDDEGDILVNGGSVDLRAEKNARGRDRTYTVRATATDLAGNTGTALGTCEVPHSQGRRR